MSGDDGDAVSEKTDVDEADVDVYLTMVRFLFRCLPGFPGATAASPAAAQPPDGRLHSDRRRCHSDGCDCLLLLQPRKILRCPLLPICNDTADKI